MIYRNQRLGLLAVCAIVWLTTSEVGQAQSRTSQHGNPRVAAVPRVARPAVAPFQPLSAAHQKDLDKILQFWEYSSSKIKRYRCKFERLEYDPVFGPKTAAKTWSKGSIKFAAPDKGLFQVEELYHYTLTPDKQIKFLPRPGESMEKWICDGTTVFEFDTQNKRLIERQLPPEMQGKAIAEGPLPFLFGAKAETIKQRYWVRLITPRDKTDEYWIQAFPKRQQDAANYLKVEVIIDKEDFLPKALQIFDRNYNARTNPARTVLQFKDRQVNWLEADPLKLFTRHFFKPPTPKGWTRLVESYQQTTPPPRQTNQARRPGAIRLPSR